MPNHITIICPHSGGRGAVANVALHHARELARGFRVTLASNSFPGYDTPGVARLLLQPLHFGLLRRFAHVPNEIAFALAARAAVARLHADSPVDFILCHGHPVATLAARPLRRRLGIPYGLVTHGDIFDRPKGTYDPRLTWFYQRTTRPAYQAADLVIALSPYMANLAIRGGARPERVVVIPNGIDPGEIGLDGMAPPLARKPMDRLEILYVGRLSVEKGVDVLLAAVALLKARGVAFRLRLAGSGPQAQHLRSLAAQLKLDEAVEFLGLAPRTQLGALYRSADVVCAPSRSDPLPTVVLEAMAAGVAVVGTDVGGIPFMVIDEVTGLVCPSENSSALAEALGRFAVEEGLAPRMGLAGQQRVTREFTWSKIVDRLGTAINQA